MKKTKRLPPATLTRKELISFIEQAGKDVKKRDILKAFRVKGLEKDHLLHMIRELKHDGTLQKKHKAPRQDLPKTLLVKGAGLSKSGDRMAVPAVWRKESPPPAIYITKTGKKLEEGQTALVRLGPLHGGAYEGHVIRLISRSQERLYGIVNLGQFMPTSRKFWYPFNIAESAIEPLADGDFVVAEITSPKHAARQTVKIIERISALDPRKLSQIAIYEHEVPASFSHAALDEARAAKPVTPSQAREDLTHLPIVTIDGEDARDFDDAVFAEADGENFHLIVAIADVSHYVKPKSALDEEAFIRGNSVYFPDQVVPMLPEELSNDLCSLRPHENRPVLAVHLTINPHGKIEDYRFTRALIKSQARLTYTQVQNAYDGNPDAKLVPLMDKVIKPLYTAFFALARARDKRGTLDLSFPEYKLRLDHTGEVLAIDETQRLDSHRLIEEFMIAANVAAALCITEHHLPGIFRNHERPTADKLEHLIQLTNLFGLFFKPKDKKGQSPSHEEFKRLIHRVEGTPHSTLIQEAILRSQAQANYAPENFGHYGLALTHYCHFTSPIRRYADLMVHRALIGYLTHDKNRPSAMFLQECAEHISTTERRAQVAERDTFQRYTARYMAGFKDQNFEGRISYLSFGGIYVKLNNGSEGVIPMESLPRDYYMLDPHGLKMTGRKTGKQFHLGETLMVTLRESNAASGRILLSMIELDTGMKNKGKTHRDHGKRRKR